MKVIIAACRDFEGDSLHDELYLQPECAKDCQTIEKLFENFELVGGSPQPGHHHARIRLFPLDEPRRFVHVQNLSGEETRVADAQPRRQVS